jgi:PII-like signaling protein
MLPRKGELLRIYIGQSDTYEGIPLYEWIVKKAHEKGLAGATVVRGLEGFANRGRVHTAKIMRLSSNLPVIVEIVDTPQKIEDFLPLVDEAIQNGMITVENIRIRLYRDA